MARAKGFSLWLMPSGDLYEALAHTILRLSRVYQTPAFEPHVTLLGELTEPEAEVLSKTQHLASLIRPCEIRLSRADYLSDYFRCLFLRVEETKPVMEANLKARKVFNRYRDPKYMPHLSLMYGSLGPGVKETIVPRVGDYFDKRFEVRSVHLFLTEDEPRDWYRVREFPLETAEKPDAKLCAGEDEGSEG